MSRLCKLEAHRPIYIESVRKHRIVHRYRFRSRVTDSVGKCLLLWLDFPNSKCKHDALCTRPRISGIRCKHLSTEVHSATPLYMQTSPHISRAADLP